MIMEDYVNVGRIGKTHGLKGELKLTLEDQFLMDVMQVEALFVEERGKKTPYFIDYLRGKGTLILKLEDINSRESAALLTSKYVFARSEDITVEKELIDDTVYGYLVDYTIVDAELGKLGSIESIEVYPQQEMAVLTYKEEDFLIPLNEAFIDRINESEKVVYMDLPEGLLDVS